MKKLFFALFIALAVIGCKKDDDSKGDDPIGDVFFFNNGKDGNITISVGQSEVISMTGVSLTQLNFTSSNSEVAAIEGNAIVAKAEGTADITAALKSDPSKTAVLHVTVVDYFKNIKFNSVYWMQATEEWHDKCHAIYRLRRNRGQELPDGGDAQLTRVDDYAFTGECDTAAAIQTVVDAFQVGNWYYLYTTTDGTEIGVFQDSIRAARSWLLSSDAFFNGDGEFTVAGQGALMEFTDFYMYDIKYSYCLGDRMLCDDVTEMGKQYVKTGAEYMPYPGYIQVGHFNEGNYLEFFDIILRGGEADEADYPFFDTYDSHMMMYWTYVDPETGESGMNGWYLGWPELEEAYDDINFDLESDENTGWFKMSYYHFVATVMPAFADYGLATEYIEDTDEPGYYFKDPLEMAPMQTVTYEGGVYPVQKPAKNGVRPQNSEKPIRTSILNKQMAVTNTIGATLRMVLTSK